MAKPGRGVKNEMLYVVGKAIRKPLVQTVSFELDRYKTMSKQAQAESRGHRHRNQIDASQPHFCQFQLKTPSAAI